MARLVYSTTPRSARHLLEGGRKRLLGPHSGGGVDDRRQPRRALGFPPAHSHPPRFQAACTFKHGGTFVTDGHQPPALDLEAMCATPTRISPRAMTPPIESEHARLTSPRAAAH